MTGTAVDGFLARRVDNLQVLCIENPHLLPQRRARRRGGLGPAKAPILDAPLRRTFPRRNAVTAQFTTVANWSRGVVAGIHNFTVIAEPSYPQVPF